jgi:hypothetical protein
MHNRVLSRAPSAAMLVVCLPHPLLRSLTPPHALGVDQTGLQYVVLQVPPLLLLLLLLLLPLVKAMFSLPVIYTPAVSVVSVAHFRVA